MFLVLEFDSSISYLRPSVECVVRMYVCVCDYVCMIIESFAFQALFGSFPLGRNAQISRRTSRFEINMRTVALRRVKVVRLDSK